MSAENKSKTKKTKAKVKVYSKKKSQNDPEKVFIQKLQEKYTSIDLASITNFSDFPLSPKTLKGLKKCGYSKPTEIQKETLLLALQSKDILGAAKTGSGKTLAFLIPLLECLFSNQWTRLDGLGAIVITPTRELAYQIFETLRRVGEFHDFSAGLIIGGKDLKFERSRMDNCSIVVCTPGRLLQHMDENPLFDCVNMKILVLDEADRCLDMGFEPTMNAIIANLPLERQTLLFSATQTKSVKDLARLSLKDPSYVSVHEHAQYSTPSGLQQSYVICELKDKISIIWSFIKNHVKQKIIVFFASSKQVKYIFEIFSKLRPGLSLMALYGTLHQLKRMEVYESFCRKSSAVLFATDLAARGLDFPEVHWVVQVDCPEDSATYIHRVGRTARFHKGGESLLLLLESEQDMVENLEQRKIPIEKIEINPIRLNNPVRKMEAFLASSTTIKDSAQRAFVSYVKSVFLMKDKKIFNVESLDTDSYAHSLGLAIPPRIRFLQRMTARKNNPTPGKKTYFDDVEENDIGQKKFTENVNEEIEAKLKFKAGNEESEDSGVSEDEGDEHGRGSEYSEKDGRGSKSSKKDKLGLEYSDKDGRGSTNTKKDRSGLEYSKKDRRSLDPEKEQRGLEYSNEESSHAHDLFHVSDSDSDEDGEGILKVKRKDHDFELPTAEDIEINALGRNKSRKPLTRVAAAKKMLKKNIVPNKKIVFTDEGAAVVQRTKERQSEMAVHYENEDLGGINIETARKVLIEEDKFDKQLFKEKVKAKHKEEKRKLKALKKRERDGDDEQSEQDDFGEDQSDVEADTSWLPDPDKMYGEKTAEELEQLEEEVTGKATVKKIKEQKSSKKRKQEVDDHTEDKIKKKKKKISKISSALSVNEAEELALMLLKK